MDAKTLKIEMLKYTMRKYLFELSPETIEKNIRYYINKNNKNNFETINSYTNYEEYENRNILYILSKPNNQITQTALAKNDLEHYFLYGSDDFIDDLLNNLDYKKDEIYNYNRVLKNIRNYKIQSNIEFDDNITKFFQYKINCIKNEKALIIQKAFRKYRYDPQFKFCEIVQLNNFRDIGVDV